jgi:hypothetical protein
MEQSALVLWSKKANEGYKHKESRACPSPKSKF